MAEPLAGDAAHVAHHDLARVLADCAARRRLVLACPDARPGLHPLGARPEGLDVPLPPEPGRRPR